MPGIYQLPQSLQLRSQHSNLTLEGCHDGAELQAEPGNESKFLHGLIVLNRADSVTLRNLRFQLPISPFMGVGGKLTPFSEGEGFGEDFQKNLRVSIGIRPLHSALLTVQNCLFRFAVEKDVNLFAVGIFAGSECWGLKLLENRFLRDEEYLLLEQKTGQNEQRFLIGYLLAPALIPRKNAVNKLNIVLSLLQDGIIRDNRFTGLTTAILILADTGLVRIENNTVIECISGFWLTPIELGEILRTNLQTAILGISFPLPSFFDVSKLAQEYPVKFENIAGGKFENIAGIDRLSLSLHVLSNDIDAGIVEESMALSGPGLVIKRLNTQNRDRPITSSVILTANKIRRGKDLISNLGNAIENYTVLIDNVERCTVTGNVILNESAKDKRSLVISLDQEIRAIAAIAITGNVFQGEPSLPDRFNINTGSSTVSPPMNTWKFLNTVIE
ncbi:hypothetical protein [Nostoc sp. WHI]|uniref:hypothetical protein n=1 Tax=Nostoc sp. WHI TaxID=2650611 RepID=UPI0018C70F53|nr:hypothetical protein [Nostoc sp. WHI]MBG1270895.1 hypothetical protein [Nostoc sp. WHI]